jgi:hypothetical protein
MPRFEFEHQKYLLVGVDQQSRMTAEGISNFVGGIGVFTPLNVNGLLTMYGVHSAKQWIQGWASKQVKGFRVEFRNSPPLWASTDDDHWWFLIDFFRIKRIGFVRPD